MTEPAVQVTCLYDGETTPEQEAAYEWAENVAATSRVSLTDLRASHLADADVVWWHRDDPLSVAAADRATPLRSYLDDGGSLVLSLRALSAVPSLGIDDVPPDSVGVDEPDASAGLLQRTLHDDHPAFETFSETRVPTRAAGDEQPYARYEHLAPASGDVIASEFRGEDYLVGYKSMIEWDCGAGRVLGIGSGLGFAHAGNFEAAANQERVMQNALWALADGNGRTVDGRPDGGDGFRTLRADLSDDTHRTAYHLSGPANWLNDPNGMVKWNGRYHVFYQYNPGGPFHNAIHWGHAVSDDLLHWRDLPVALEPDPGGPDRDGCWSGCTFVDDGTPTLLYTGGRGREQLPCLATAADDLLRSWEKHPGNPIIEETPTDIDLIESEDWAPEFRDHCVWREDGTWYQLIGSGVADVGGTALLYRAEDVETWEYVGPLLTGDWDGAGPIWECPELLDFGEKQVLHVSNYDEVQYVLGEADVDGPTFSVDERGTLDYGDYYAPQSLRDDENDRYVTVGWLPEARDVARQWDAGWSGVMSLPRRLDVAPDGTLRQRPTEEVTALRDHRVASGARTLSAGDRHTLDVADNRYELAMDVELDDDATLTLAVCESPARSERTEIRYDGDHVVVDRSESSLAAGVTTDEQRMPVEGDTLSLRLFVDGSVVELFANERRCLTSRIYPTRDDADGAALEARGGEVSVSAFDAWELASTWDTPTGR